MKNLVPKFSLLSILLLFNGTSVESNVSIDLDDARKVVEQWKYIDKTVNSLVKSGVQMLLPQVMESVNQINMSSKCLQQSMELAMGVRKMKLWAFYFVDATTKSFDGLLSGTTTSLGVYKECLKSEAPSKDLKKPKFVGKYCQVAIKPPLPIQTKNYKVNDKVEALENFTGSEVLRFFADKVGMMYEIPYRIGVCIPSGCSLNDIEQLVGIMLGKIHLSAKITYCHVKEPAKYSKISIFAIVFSCLLALIVLIGTAFERIFTRKKITPENIGCKLLVCFSIVSNFKVLFNTESSRNNLKFLDGIKFLTVAVIALSHGYLYPFFVIHMYSSLLYVYDLITDPISQVLISTHVAYDTLFFYSGLTTSYMCVKHVIVEQGSFSIKFLICHKLWRTVPAYYFVILFTMLISLMGSGPGFDDAMNFSIDNCYKYWWSNLLFFNNFYGLDHMCMYHTWIIACEMQLFLFAVIVLFILKRSAKAGIIMSVLVILASMLYKGIFTYFEDLIPGFYAEYFGKKAVSDSLLKSVTTPLGHASPYFIGVLLGYKIAKNSEVKCSKKCIGVGWLVTILGIGYTLLLTSRWKPSPPSNIERSMYAAFYRTTWAIGISWITFCCATSRGGFINSFLSWKAWIPLSKLSFLIYLIQPSLQLMYIALFNTTHDFAYFEMVVVYMGLLLMSAILAILCNLLIQSPLISIEKTLFGKKSSPDGTNHVGTEKYPIEELKTKM